jgi:hypothetical protein
VGVERQTFSLGYFLRWQSAAFSAGAAAIHFAEISTHFEEYWVFGTFFFAVAWFQAASAVAIAERRDLRLLDVVVMVNAITIGIWIWSRTAGLPIGPEAGEAEAVGAADLLATVLEALLVSWTFAIRTSAVGSRRASRAVGVGSTIVLWTGVIVMTGLVFFAGTGGPMTR